MLSDENVTSNNKNNRFRKKTRTRYAASITQKRRQPTTSDHIVMQQGSNMSVFCQGHGSFSCSIQ